ncbi:unnamed protein product [Ilex paraguariensis]|uniref:Exocyst subunit Exo70 family protein n=1 Tax=Ilex paraguariensis TaxID=185542 RepID=A0ABC8R691_9AQUA
MNRAYLDLESVSARSSVASTRSSTSDYEDEDGDIGPEDYIKIAGNSISEVGDVSNMAMVDLRSIAECMISSRYGKECVKIYKIIRKSIVDEGIYRLGVEKLSSSHLRKMDWEVLEQRIKNWLNAVRIAIKTLFNGERILCDHVFASSKIIRELVYTEVIKEGASILFGFPENVARNSKKSPERVFRTLDMYTAIANHWPEIKSIFSFESTSKIRSEALTSLVKLSESIYHCLGKSSSPESYFDTSDFEDFPLPAISLRFAWLILVLLCKLNGKAKHYKDDSLSYLFLAKNLNYVVSKVRMSNMKYLLGDDWLTKHETKVKQFALNYERIAWSRVVGSLPEDPTVVTSPEEVKECFKRFNSLFDQAYKRQSVCVVPDSKLRDEIKVSLARKPESLLGCIGSSIVLIGL